MLTAGESHDPTSPTGAGRVLSLIRDGEAVTRADLARRTGLARSTVAQRVEALLAHHLVYEAGGSASTGGRPPTVLAFNRGAGVVLVADLGATHSRLAVSDLGGDAARRARVRHRCRARPGDRARAGCTSASSELLGRGRARRGRDVRGIGIGVPAPVAFSRGEPVAPPMMPGWDGFSIPGWFSRHYDAPVLVDNDVNIMALGEHWTHWRDCEHLLYVKIGTGIGCGIVSDSRIHRGAQGAAGDIGHVRLAGHDDVVCRCGNIGCLEAVAGGRALAAQADRGRAGGDDLARRRPARARGRARRRSRRCATPAATSARCSPSASTSSTRARSSSAATSPRPTSSCSRACARSRSGARCRWPRATCAWAAASSATGPA